MVSLLSSYWMVALPVSVLALSSRFDGQGGEPSASVVLSVSVLALSSRFDGLAQLFLPPPPPTGFQYSLCRVVLMVEWIRITKRKDAKVSVLALSSRFDGLLQWLPGELVACRFSTRSVESF